MTILLIDSYDSFTFNLKNLIEESTGDKVVTVHNDTLSADQLSKYLDLFSAVIVGPGPGHPANKEDVGIIPFLFDGSISSCSVPILGICLGFQSLCLSQGCKVAKLSSIRHGQVYQVSHSNDELFSGLDQSFESVRYHSLHVPKLCDSLIDLAYCNDDDDEKIIMAAKHKSQPWYGVQYHPESICSENGKHLVQNFMKVATQYNTKSRNVVTDSRLLNELISTVKTEALIPHSYFTKSKTLLKSEKVQSDKSAIEICETLHKIKREFILLNSASHPGTWSIIGLPKADSLRITHSTEAPEDIILTQNGYSRTEKIKSIWEYLSKFMQDHLSIESNDFPFIGGLMGLFSYEEGHHLQLGTLPKMTKENIPDTKLIFIENLIMVNNSTKEIFALSIANDDFIHEIQSAIQTPITFPTPSDHIKTISITKPIESEYKSKYSKCQEFLASGDSYELCLTSSTKIQIPKETDAWEIYKTLTIKNPSPYSAFMNFDDCTLISSSPERFISWDNEMCELRPIKGTVKKTPEMTFAKASTILNTPKEIGENLMIVDLIRHDLYQLLKKVEVTKLMNVEEYSTVYQLVSIIQGHFTNTPFSGIDILSKSLPPGSMTGAPKKRSVEILQKLENSRRGIYSGVCGYWSINNKADWSVIIRSLFHYKTDLENDEDSNIWRIGAGGAITVLSDPEGEWQELLTKLDSALQTFTL